MQELGLFPLPLVLVPTERLPLHIFEPRYKELISECLEGSAEFGLVLATGDGAVHSVGLKPATLDYFEDYVRRMRELFPAANLNDSTQSPSRSTYFAVSPVSGTSPATSPTFWP